MQNKRKALQTSSITKKTTEGKVMLKARNSFRPPLANFQWHSFVSMADSLCHVLKPSVHLYISVSDSWDNLLFYSVEPGKQWQLNDKGLSDRPTRPLCNFLKALKNKRNMLLCTDRVHIKVTNPGC